MREAAGSGELLMLCSLAWWQLHYSHCDNPYHFLRFSGAISFPKIEIKEITLYLTYPVPTLY